MESLILNIVEQYGYIGVFLLIAIENIFPPIPSEVILLFAGFAASKVNLSIYLTVIFATLGSIVGALVLYYFGKKLGVDRLKTIVNSKVGKVLKLREEDVTNANNWFDRRGTKAVLLARFIPIVRSLVSLPAGINKMNIFKFTLYTTIGTFIWNSILVIIGNKVGEKWIYIASILDTYSYLILILLLISVFLVFIFIYVKRKKL